MIEITVVWLWVYGKEDCPDGYEKIAMDEADI